MAQPHLLTDPDDVHEIALLPGDPDRVERIASQCDDAVQVSENREYRVVNATYDGTPLTICSTGIGCPSAAIAVEELAACGVDTLLRVGTCGALQAGIRTGDLVVATAAAKDEGTTRRYEADTVPAVAHRSVVRALTDAVRESADVVDATGRPGTGEEVAREEGLTAAYAGALATDDAFYAETDDYVAAWNEANLLAVEMEAAAVFSLARRKEIRAGALCTVDGNLVAGTKKDAAADGQELPADARSGIERAIGIALEAAAGVDRST